jgi:flagellar protein FliO/FliZ
MNSRSFRGVVTVLLAAVPDLVLAVARAAPAASAPEPVGVGGMFQVLLGLLAVLAMIVGAAWLARRVGGFNVGASGALRIIGGLSMGPRERVVLVQVGERQLLLGVAPGRVSTLHVLEQPLTPAAPAAPAPDNFAARLAAVLKQGRPT